VSHQLAQNRITIIFPFISADLRVPPKTFKNSNSGSINEPVDALRTVSFIVIFWYPIAEELKKLKEKMIEIYIYKVFIERFFMLFR